MTTTHERDAQWQDDLLPHIVDRLARERPDAEYGEWVTGSGVVAITYAQLANVINGLAWWLVDQLGGPGGYGSHPEVLTYVGANDVRYSALLLAAAKAGYVLFVTSPRNSPAAHRALFGHLQSKTLITSDPVPPPARIILDAVQPLRHLLAPSVEALLTEQYPAYVLDKTFQELRRTPMAVMHTSGTTGLPKPIVWVHETCTQVLNSKNGETPRGTSPIEHSLVNGKRVIVTLPPFHGALLAQLVVGAIPYGNVVIAPVAAAIPTAQAVVDALKQTPADVAILIPSVVAELAQNQELLDYCAAHLETIIYIGGDLPQGIGDRIAAKLYLRCMWGATETGVLPQLLPPQLLPSAPSSRSIWRYIRFDPCSGAIFDEVTDDVYELVLQRKEALASTQPCFTVPGIDQLEKEYRTKDLFQPHPDIPDLWRWCARSDDIIVFLNGEKTNPISMEQHIMASNPEVSGALVIGAQRFQAALLIEPASESPLTTAEQAALIEHIWPSVDESNRSAPAHARVEKSFILVLSPDRRLIRAGKGTYMRGPSISQYTEEIERLYTNADVISNDDDDSVGETAPTGLDGITRLVRQHVRAVTDWSSLDDADNFFDRGVDSLQGLQLTRALRRSFQRPDFALSTIYQNPTVSQLAAAILTRNKDEQNEREAMGNLLTTYRGLIQQIPVSKDSTEGPGPSGGPVNVLLTGSTGTIGTHLLQALLDRDGIAHIFCLNRGEDGGRATQYKNFAAAGLATARLDDRVTFVRTDLQAPLLDLDGPTYESLRTQIGLIIHAAWPVNFNLALSAFRPQFAGLVNLFTLAGSAASPTVRFVFVSSVTAVEGYTPRPAPEAIFDSFDTPAPFGYGRAKFLAELLVDAAGRHLGNLVPTTVVRVGQAAGSVRHRGIWNLREWIPSIVLSSRHLGQVPGSLGPVFDNVDFVPVDLLGGILVDFAMATTATGATTVFNLRNPHITPWRALLPAITNSAATQPLQVVAPATWLASLRASSDSDNDDATAINPAVKLLDFLDDLLVADTDTKGGLEPPMAVERALEASPAMRNLEAVKLEWMQKWVEEWIAGQRELIS